MVQTKKTYNIQLNRREKKQRERKSNNTQTNASIWRLLMEKETTKWNWISRQNRDQYVCGLWIVAGIWQVSFHLVLLYVLQSKTLHVDHVKIHQLSGENWHRKHKSLWPFKHRLDWRRCLYLNLLYSIRVPILKNYYLPMSSNFVSVDIEMRSSWTPVSHFTLNNEEAIKVHNVSFMTLTLMMYQSISKEFHFSRIHLTIKGLHDVIHF